MGARPVDERLYAYKPSRGKPSPPESFVEREAVATRANGAHVFWTNVPGQIQQSHRVRSQKDFRKMGRRKTKVCRVEDEGVRRRKLMACPGGLRSFGHGKAMARFMIMLRSLQALPFRASRFALRPATNGLVLSQARYARVSGRSVVRCASSAAARILVERAVEKAEAATAAAASTNAAKAAVAAAAVATPESEPEPWHLPDVSMDDHEVSVGWDSKTWSKLCAHQQLVWAHD